MNELMLLWAAIKWLLVAFVSVTVVLTLMYGSMLLIWLSIKMIAQDFASYLKK